MLGHTIATQPGEVSSFPPLPLFLIFDLVDSLGIPGELIVKMYKHPSWWWESRTPRWRVFEACLEPAGGLCYARLAGAVDGFNRIDIARAMYDASYEENRRTTINIF